MQDSATAVLDHEEAVQHPEGGGGHGEKSMAAIASRWFLRKVNSVSKGERALDRVNSFAVLQLGA